MLFIALFFAGVALLVFAQSRHDWHTIGTLLEHLASAIIVAAVMGVTYEYFVHQHVIEDFAFLLEQHERATEEALDSMRTTTTRDVLTLLGDIAVNTNRIPTLFTPARNSANEIVFSKDKRFFDRLVGTPNARAEAIEVLRKWLRSSKLNLRFLASDFVGLLHLHELEQEIRELAQEQQKRWREITADERSVVLNYWWAASRCQPKKYELLRDRLVNWKDPFVQEWILFVPRQMPDAELAKLVALFLRLRGSEASAEILRATIDAIEVLHHSTTDMRRTVRVNKTAFERAGLWVEACAAVSAVPGNAQSQSRVLRGLRRAGEFFRKWRAPRS